MFSSRNSVYTFAAFTVGALLLMSTTVTVGNELVKLSGDQEMPPVETKASGKGMIVVNSDKSLKGEVTTTGIKGTAANIEVGRPGLNGPVLVPLTRNGGNAWSVPTGAKLSDTQYENYRAGRLYLNVHSVAHPEGEIRGHLKPEM